MKDQPPLPRPIRQTTSAEAHAAVMEAAATLPSLTLRVEPMPPAGLLFLDPEA